MQLSAPRLVTFVSRALNLTGPGTGHIDVSDARACESEAGEPVSAVFHGTSSDTQAKPQESTPIAHGVKSVNAT